ncbi:MAG: MmgE/PrpD family protein [Pseudomonadota bacterium]
MFPASARAVARMSILDWSAVMLAGLDEPVSRMVRRMVGEEGGAPAATVFGLDGKRPARAAALANGAASHALDYDDTHFAYVGHPSVAVFPAALAIAEKTGASGADLLAAFLIGAETACRVGRFLGSSHYQHGFHQTATSGAFGATAACARLMVLSQEQTRHALGIAATRASGLKSQFGTMGKPFHAGMAAANGVEAARLASFGVISRPDGIECEQVRIMRAKTDCTIQARYCNFHLPGMCKDMTKSKMGLRIARTKGKCRPQFVYTGFEIATQAKSTPQ